VSLDALRRHRDDLTPDSQRLLARAAAEGRELDHIERLLIFRYESFAALDDAPWSFLEGLVTQSVRRGAWLLLDELNLAEPAVIERLNPLLDTPRSMILTEGYGTRFGGGDEAIHPEFAVLATMNPATYAGRAPLSPAFANRFMMVQTRNPDEAACQAMIRFLIDGRQPTVEVGGERWSGLAGVRTQPPLTVLRGRGLEHLLERLAAFHCAVVAATTSAPGRVPEVGAGRRQPYVFGRRDLRRALEFLSRALLQGRGRESAMQKVIEHVYLARLESADRPGVELLAETHGVGTGQRPEAILSNSSAPARLRLDLTNRLQTVSGVYRGEPLRWEFRAARDQTVEFTTSPSSGGTADWDTVLRIYLGTHKVAEDDDGGDRHTSLLRKTIEASGVYDVELAQWRSSSVASKLPPDLRLTFTLAYRLV